MPVPESPVPPLLLAIGLAACGPAAAPAGSEALIAPADACPDGTMQLEGTCRTAATVEYTTRREGVMRLTLRSAGGSSWWFAPEKHRMSEAIEACRAIGADVFLPRDRVELGVGRHFATLASITAGENDAVGVWVGLRVDLTSGLIVDLDHQPVASFLGATPPVGGSANDPVLEEVQQALDQLANGELPETPRNCLRIASDGTLRPHVCGYIRNGVVCRPRP